VTGPAIPPGAITAAWAEAPESRRHICHGGTEIAEISRSDLRRMLEAAAPLVAAAERERLAQAAGELKFTLYRPGNGPGAGSQALDVVPLTGLLALLREQP